MRYGASFLLCVSLSLAAGSAFSADRRSEYLESEAARDSVPVKMYARLAGVGLEEARLALAREELAAPQIAELRAEFSDRLAGLFWARLPTQHIVVRLTGDSYVPSREIRTDAGVVKVSFVTGAAATIDKLISSLQAAMPKLQKAMPELSGAWVDETTGTVVLTIDAPQTSKRVYDAERGAIEKETGFPVEFRFSPRPSDLISPPTNATPALPTEKAKQALPNVGGGRQLSSGAGQFCTTGFAVKHSVSGALGVLTAGHCFNDATYTNYPVPPAILPTVIVPTELVMEAWGGATDFQWHTFPPGKPVTSAYCTSFNSCSNVVIYSGSPSVGALACHMGRTTGRSCGTVTSVTYVFPGACPNADQATFPSGTWVSIEGSELACAGGDSGGPVFNGYTAYGLAKAALSSGPLAGSCGLLVVMPIGRIAPYGLRLL